MGTLEKKKRTSFPPAQVASDVNPELECGKIMKNCKHRCCRHQGHLQDCLSDSCYSMERMSWKLGKKVIVHCYEEWEKLEPDPAPPGTERSAVKFERPLKLLQDTIDPSIDTFDGNYQLEEEGANVDRWAKDFKPRGPKKVEEPEPIAETADLEETEMAEASGTQSLDEPFDFDPVLLALRAWEWVGTVPPPPLPKNWKMPYDFDLANYLALNSPRTGDLRPMVSEPISEFGNHHGSHASKLAKKENKHLKKGFHHAAWHCNFVADKSAKNYVPLIQDFPASFQIQVPASIEIQNPVSPFEVPASFNIPLSAPVRKMEVETKKINSSEEDSGAKPAIDAKTGLQPFSPRMAANFFI